MSYVKCGVFSSRICNPTLNSVVLIPTFSNKKAPAANYGNRGFFQFNPGNDLVSHKSPAQYHRPRGLTSVFGMGNGVTLW